MVNGPRWRSTSPISVSDAPAASIDVAAVWRSRCAYTVPNPARSAAAADRLGHPTRADPAVRGPDPDEQPAIQRIRRSPPLQIVDDRLPDITRQRQPIRATALPGDDEFAAAPIDVVQTRPATSPRRSPTRASRVSIA